MGKQVWLAADELDELLAEAEDAAQSILFELMGRSGLRRDEALSVAPQDVVDGPAGAMVRVQSGKGDKYRETPIPDGLRGRIEGYAERQEDPSEPLVDVWPSTVNGWVARAAERRQDDTGDAGWQYVTPHDLRRSWAQGLLDSGVETAMVMEWGGWDDYETFRDHYKGVHSPRKQQEERGKVSWL